MHRVRAKVLAAGSASSTASKQIVHSLWPYGPGLEASPILRALYGLWSSRDLMSLGGSGRNKPRRSISWLDVVPTPSPRASVVGFGCGWYQSECRKKIRTSFPWSSFGCETQWNGGSRTYNRVHVPVGESRDHRRWDPDLGRTTTARGWPPGVPLVALRLGPRSRVGAHVQIDARWSDAPQ